MNKELIKRYSLLEIALLAVLVAGLFCAFLIVKVSQKVIVLTEPISLADSGLTISLPAEPGWKLAGSWQLENDDTVTLMADHFENRKKDCQVLWRYGLASEPLTPEQLLQKRAKSMHAEMQDVRQTSGSHPMYYARFLPSQQKEGIEFILGILPLDFGRRIELQISGLRSFDDTDENLFRALAESVTYQVPEDLDRGLKLLTAFTADSSVFSQTQKDTPAAFVIKDTQSTNLGYYTLEKSDDRFQSNYFEFQNQRRQSNLLFKPWPAEMFWKTTAAFSGVPAPATFNIVTDANHNLSITGRSGQAKTLFCDHFMLPDMLLDEFARAFLDSPNDPVCIDILTYLGTILPARLTKIAVDQAHAGSEETVSVVRVEYPLTEGVFEELFFDQSKQIIGKYVNTQHRVRLWDKTTVPELQELFKDAYQQTAAPFACVNVTR